MKYLLLIQLLLVKFFTVQCNNYQYESYIKTGIGLPKDKALWAHNKFFHSFIAMGINYLHQNYKSRILAGLSYSVNKNSYQFTDLIQKQIIHNFTANTAIGKAGKTYFWGVKFYISNPHIIIKNQYKPNQNLIESKRIYKNIVPGIGFFVEKKVNHTLLFCTEINYNYYGKFVAQTLVNNMAQITLKYQIQKPAKK